MKKQTVRGQSDDHVNALMNKQHIIGKRLVRGKGLQLQGTQKQSMAYSNNFHSLQRDVDTQTASRKLSQ